MPVTFGPEQGESSVPTLGWSRGAHHERDHAGAEPGRGPSGRELLALLLVLPACTPPAPQPGRPAGQPSPPAAVPAAAAASPVDVRRRRATPTKRPAANRRQGDLLQDRPRLVLAGTGPGRSRRRTRTLCRSLRRRRPRCPRSTRSARASTRPRLRPMTSSASGSTAASPATTSSSFPQLLADGSGLPVPLPGRGSHPQGGVPRRPGAHRRRHGQHRHAALRPRPSATRPSPAMPRPATSRACSATGSASAVR